MRVIWVVLLASACSSPPPSQAIERSELAPAPVPLKVKEVRNENTPTGKLVWAIAEPVLKIGGGAMGAR